jgi:micrococcal nuclease
MPPRPYLVRSNRSRPSQRLPWWVKFPLAYALAGSFMLGALVVVGVERSLLSQWIMDPPLSAAVTTPTIRAQFDICSSRQRITCVVDGDTFWLEGTKYRIADLNTPEVSSPSCPQEAALGQRATARLIALLNAAPFTLGDYDRDEDQYGRKLRIIERNGQSIANTMIAEGLAHPWRGKRESWC